jgi:hypothetical protein
MKFGGLRRARESQVKRRGDGSVIGQDDGRPPGMTGRQWKRLRKAEHALRLLPLGGHPNIDAARIECRKRIDGAHRLAELRALTPGVKFRPSRPPWKRFKAAEAQG